MTVEEVIENELKCVQRDCCRLENECAKCDLVLPKEEIINAYNKALKLEKENAGQKKKIENLQKYLDTQNCYRECAETWVKLTEAKEIILKLYNAGRDVLMCRTEEKAYENLSHAINDRSIEQFLKESEDEKCQS